MNRAIILTLVFLLILFSLPPHWSIVVGIVFSQILKLTPTEIKLLKNSSSRILQGSIILLGSSLNFKILLEQGLSGVLTTSLGLGSVLITGELLARFFKVPSPLSTLISVGTAICGGSAIGAISPVMRADNFSIAVSLGIIFILNASAVFLFPLVGKILHLSQEQFGTWAALAIHDTSAVVAATSSYGEKALSDGTTLKLIRALWIIPVTSIYAFIKKSQHKITYPWFILFFVAASLCFTFISELQPWINPLKKISRTGFALTLFLIGLTLGRKELKSIHPSTLLFGISLWMITLSASLCYVYFFL